MSPSPRKAWIETGRAGDAGGVIGGRLPPGRRGLKLASYRQGTCNSCRLPPGRRGLKQGITIDRVVVSTCRLPPGRRGLKPVGAGLFQPARTVAFPPEGVD